MPGTGIQILWSREFSSEVDMIMLYNKIQKPGKMVQLGRGEPSAQDLCMSRAVHTCHFSAREAEAGGFQPVEPNEQAQVQ